ncbi:MAG TPA: DUF3267 domain-containing protein [Prolixibacteraceae bacterium]|jgi:hypothetical protein
MRLLPKDLNENPEYELIIKLEHSNAKQFVKEQLRLKSKLTKRYLWYQFSMATLLTALICSGFILWYAKSAVPMLFIIGAILFSFTVLVLIHEMLHVLALLFLGFNKISLGGDIRRFVFYALADEQVLSRREFYILALFPLLIIKAVTVAAILFTIITHSPWLWFWIITMAIHSFFCAGDIGLISFFDHNPDKEVFTYDSKIEKSTYFFQKI